jgi:hypothetical protein
MKILDYRAIAELLGIRVLGLTAEETKKAIGEHLKHGKISGEQFAHAVIYAPRLADDDLDEGQRGWADMIDELLEGIEAEAEKKH